MYIAVILSVWASVWMYFLARANETPAFCKQRYDITRERVESGELTETIPRLVYGLLYNKEKCNTYKKSK